MREITYSRTPIGQIVYDLGFTQLSDRYLARKHKMTIADLRELRTKVRDALAPKRRRRTRR